MDALPKNQTCVWVHTKMGVKNLKAFFENGLFYAHFQVLHPDEIEHWEYRS